MGTFSDADFIYEIDGDVVTVRDLNLGNISVTNDAQNVIAKLHALLDLTDKKVEYYDSEGQLDKLLHENGVFTGFAPGGWT